MSFFGVFASLFSGGVLLVETCKDAQYATNNREEARRKGKLTYGDGKGNEYLVSTGEKVYTHGGKVYSVKHPTTVLHDGWKQYYMDKNTKALTEARESGKKYIMLYYPDPNGQNGYSGHYTELSTMKRFTVDKVVYLNKEIHDWDWAFFKKYYNGDSQYGGESIEITRKEFEELGGYIPYGVTPEQYDNQQRAKREKEFKKLMRGV